ncbi:DNA polymerase III subunit chi [Pontibacterium granulatum]|uniref:DNA polymerase III subunit chi n=1 Tax=Pontibacterium granulatum TaxID=2036029 RepID=UPI002499EE92|nr:DNA polymerase III subunit chi [Pontibacterium granulatum]MDI3323720.1 DNA polymerase III subunit chi [Pontibacterium granulatum]
MTEADFYVLPASDPEARALFLCRLCDRVLGTGKQMHIHCTGEEEAAHLDQLLWEHKPEAFLPHAMIGADTPAPITLGWADQRPDHQQVFVNMALDLPEDALNYERILEIVVQEPSILQATRNNYRLYQDKGITSRMNDMRKKAR